MATPKKPASKAPNVVHIPWHRRPITWGIGFLCVLLLIASSLMNMGGPEVVKAEPTKPVAKVVEPEPTPKPEPTPEPLQSIPQVIVVKIDKSDHSVRNIDNSDRSVRIIDRSDRSVRNHRTTNNYRKRDKAQSGVQSARSDNCEEYRQQHEQITAQWALMLGR